MCDLAGKTRFCFSLVNESPSSEPSKTQSLSHMRLGCAVQFDTLFAAWTWNSRPDTCPPRLVDWNGCVKVQKSGSGELRVANSSLVTRAQPDMFLPATLFNQQELRKIHSRF